MKSFLMYINQDFDPDQSLPDFANDLIKDLELNILINAMAADNQFLFDLSKTAILSTLTDIDTIRYRQAILKDCLANPKVVRHIYKIIEQAKETKQKRWMGIFSHYPRGVLSSAIKMMLVYAEFLKELRNISDSQIDKFKSEGFISLFSSIKEELNDDYLTEMDDHLRNLQFKAGAWFSANLGKGNEGENYNLRLPNAENRQWFKEILNYLTFKATPYSFTIDPRDQSGARALSDLQDRGLNLAANALAQSAEHIDSFFTNLRNELAFYVGCLNLYDKLQAMNAPITIPKARSINQNKLNFSGLYDACLALTMGEMVVGNTIAADDKDLFIITGANQGGKSTFLRSIGLAQVMLQCGMFVAADDFEANIFEAIFTHFKRKEDTTMKSGKLDEELNRMKEIVEKISPKSLILFNESLSATNEREGSEIARQIITALLDNQIKVFFVTHMYELANSFHNSDFNQALFLRAERKEDGTRTFQLKEGKPLETSFAKDVYHEVFEDQAI